MKTNKLTKQDGTNNASMSKNTRKLNSKKLYLIKKNRTLGKKASFVVKRIINRENAIDLWLIFQNSTCIYIYLAINKENINSIGICIAHLRLVLIWRGNCCFSLRAGTRNYRRCSFDVDGARQAAKSGFTFSSNQLTIPLDFHLPSANH